MAKYSVFIDTCAYYKERYNFNEKNNLVMELLKNEINIGNIEIIMPTITMEEICNDLLCDTQEYNKKIKNAVKNVFKDKPWLYNDIENYNFLIKNTRLDDFSKFIKNFKCKIIDYSSISSDSIKRVFEKYFSSELPFETSKSKKCEFPDAFTIEMLKSTDINNMIIVSNDKGFVDSVSKEVKFVFDDIKSLLQFLIKENKNSKNGFYYMSLIINTKKEELLNLVDKKIKNYPIIIPFVNVLTVSSIKTNGEINDYKLISFSKNELYFSAEVGVVADFEYMNDEQEAEPFLFNTDIEFIFKVKYVDEKYNISILKDNCFNSIFIESI